MADGKEKDVGAWYRDAKEQSLTWSKETIVGSKAPGTSRWSVDHIQYRHVTDFVGDSSSSLLALPNGKVESLADAMKQMWCRLAIRV